MSESHTDTNSHDGLALSLEGFDYYAERFRERLAELLDPALVVANRLREQSALKISNDARDRQRLELSLRNSFVTPFERTGPRTGPLGKRGRPRRPREAPPYP